jgi:DNA-binding MarR family transcriptional regulator
MYKYEHYTNSIFYQLEQTAKFCRFLGAQTFQKLKMPVTTDEFAALDVLMVHNEICQRELAKLILKDRPNTGRILNSLEEKGLVKRVADTKNNRLIRKISLTPKGEEVTKEVSIKLKDYISKLPKVFSDEDKVELISLLKQFRASLEKEVEMNI